MKKYFGWLDFNDAEDVEWAIEYLIDKNVYPSVPVRDRDASFLHFLVPDIAENEQKYVLILDKMKNAHASRKRRQDPTKKPVTFHLSNSSNKKLADLAKGEQKTKIGMLESLIEEMDELQSECSRQVQIEKENLATRFKAKVEAAQRRAEESALGRENEKLKVELAQRKAKASRLENELKASLQRMCELEVKAGILPHERISLDYEDEDEVQRRYLARLKPRIGIDQA